MEPYNHLSLRAQARALEPLTPTHSPHDSVNSSVSARTPLHTLTLHEYRKQQNSPASHATPTGKTLRRKAAAPALHKVERVASAASSRPLHFSRSAYQLTSYQALPPSPPHLTSQHTDHQPFRSQSAEPYGQGGIAPSETTLKIGEKIGKFKAIKRLPKPPAATGFRPSPSPANVTPLHRQLSSLRSTSVAPVDHSATSDSQPTPSTLSLSRFPQPPPLSGPSFSSPDTECQLPLNTASFATTAPATPPATPAVIHYRGTSFDLVNPHESLWFHNIVTPPREIESAEHLPLQSSSGHFALPEMAPKRPLYGDFGSAYTSIARRHETPADLPVAPSPAAHTPGSSPYSSALPSPESNSHIAPFAVRQPPTDSRFTLKHLTRTLTHHLSRSPKVEKGSEEELQDLSGYLKSPSTPHHEPFEAGANATVATFDGGYPRPLTQTYSKPSTNLPTYTAACWSSPPRKNRNDSSTAKSPLERALDVMNGSASAFMENSSLYSPRSTETPPLASMVPDDSSIQVGREPDARSSATGGGLASRPYYDDLDSIYPSSSIYTGDEIARSQHALSFSTNRNSNPSARMSSDADVFANEYTPGFYGYSDSQHTNHRDERSLDRGLFHGVAQKQGNDKTDTISKLIDNYKRVESVNESNPAACGSTGSSHALPVASMSGGFDDSVLNTRTDTSAGSQAVSGTQLDTPQAAIDTVDNVTDSSEPFGISRQPVGTTDVREPPSMPAPLAPPFEYDNFYTQTQLHDPSGMFSGVSSYGDTRQLLQLSQPSSATHGLGPSSSYSQTEAAQSPGTPQAALELAEKIFEDTVTESKKEAIPAMWARRNSGNLLRRSDRDNSVSVHSYENGIRADDEDNSSVDDGNDALSFKAGNDELTVEGEDNDSTVGDWETVADHEPNRVSGHLSIGESLADISTGSDSSRDSLGYSSSSLPVYEDEPLEPGSFQFQYPDQSPIRVPRGVVPSSPPSWMVQTSTRSGPPSGPPSLPVPDPPAAASAVPAFGAKSGFVENASSHKTTFSMQRAWNPIGLSDKETNELLLTGPNDEILYESDDNQPARTEYENAHGPDRQNTFDKLTTVGPKGNLTGTPQGTGMHETGSSEADNSSPGAVLGSSSPMTPTHNRARPFGTGPRVSLRESMSRTVNVRPGSSTFAAPMRARIGSSSSSSSPEHGRFYVSPGRRSSVVRITPGASFPRYGPDQEKSPSQITLFPPPTPSPPRTPRRARTHSRAAVPGQTKLRQMVLAPDANSLASTHHSTPDSEVSRIIRQIDSGRPSTSNTHTPLKPKRSEAFVQSVVAYKESPHLLCPEIAEDAQEEAERRKLSWYIFAMFCLLPPIILLYRWYGDFVIVNVSQNRFRHVSPKPKKVALVAGIVVNLVLGVALFVPIMIARAAGVV